MSNCGRNMSPLQGSDQYPGLDQGRRASLRCALAPGYLMSHLRRWLSGARSLLCFTRPNFYFGFSFKTLVSKILETLQRVFKYLDHEETRLVTHAFIPKISEYLPKFWTGRRDHHEAEIVYRRHCCP